MIDQVESDSVQVRIADGAHETGNRLERKGRVEAAGNMGTPSQGRTPASHATLPLLEQKKLRSSVRVKIVPLLV